MSLELQRFQETLRDHARRNDNASALWGDTLRIDYATLYAEVLYRQERLRDEQVRVIALALDNGVDAMLWDLAVLFEGLTCVTLPPFFSAAQRAHCLEQSQAERVIAEPQLQAELLAAGYELRGEFWCRSFNGPSRMPAGTAKLTFTSGTTGTPKGVCLSADSFLRVARELDQASAATGPEHHLALLPLAILLENLGCYAALYAGAVLSLPSQTTLGIQGASGIAVARLLGYLGEPAYTDQWGPSGDLGEFDPEGFLYLKGRKKHQFVTSYGRNVNPEWVESELTQRRHIAQAFVYGEAMPHNHALLWPHRPNCTDAELAAAVAEANEALPDYAQVHQWTRLSQPFTAANGLLTANGRPRRDAIIAQYRTQLTESATSEESA